MSEALKEEKIEPGAVNEARTKCCCQCCEEIMDLDPSWGHDQSCPKCGERLFTWSCPCCWASCCSHSQCENPPFPDFPCECCDKTQQELDEEDKREELRQEERERVERGALYRRMEEKRQHQNVIYHTTTSLYSVNSRDAFNPKNLADAMRIEENCWNEKFRPLVLAELELQNYQESDLTPQWGQQILTFFERSWLEENTEGLRCGVTGNDTGCLYFFHSPLECKIRSLREGFAECLGVYPTLPKVTVDEKLWQVSWEPDPPEGSDPREIYKTDSNKTLTLFEFILWCIRLGFNMERDFNSKYFVASSKKRTPEPIAYCPSDWVGRPKSWQAEADADFQRFFWMESPVYDWSGKKISDAEVKRMCREQMERCCVCYGLPPEGKELLICECKERLYCSEACKETHMKVHKFHPKLKHPSEKRVCCSCGEYRTGLKRCSKCKNAYFCDVNCQKWAWDSHKKDCV